MKTGVGLALICIGAILAFAVTGNTSYFNIHTAGWVLMVIGVVGLLLPNRTYGWLGRRLLVRRSYPSGQVEHIPVQPYVARNPGTQALQAGQPSRPTLLDQDDDLIDQASSGYDVVQEPEAPGAGRGYPRAGQAPLGRQQAGSTEVIEDRYEQP